jgi:hypothetical protein
MVNYTNTVLHIVHCPLYIDIQDIDAGDPVQSSYWRSLFVIFGMLVTKNHDNSLISFAMSVYLCPSCQACYKSIPDECIFMFLAARVHYKSEPLQSRLQSYKVT